MAAAAGLELAAATMSGGAMKTVHPCTGVMLSGTFKVIPGSAGMGHVVYRLRLRNIASSPCFVTDVPILTLLDSRGRALPSRGMFGGAPPGTVNAAVVPLDSGQSAQLTARFSPDIPGAGEPQMKACEKTAYKLRVGLGGWGVDVPIVPPTPICEHGSMFLSVLTH